MDNKRKLSETSVVQNSGGDVHTGSILKQESAKNERKAKRAAVLEPPPEEENEEAPVIILRHQNRELGSLAKRLRRKVKQLQTRIGNYERDRDTSIATVSCMKRAWDVLDAGIATILGDKSNASIDLESLENMTKTNGAEDPVDSHTQLLLQLARPLVHYGAADPVTSWVGENHFQDDNKENKDDDEEDEHGNLLRTRLETVDRNLQSKAHQTAQTLAELWGKLNRDEPSSRENANIVSQVTTVTSQVGLLCDMVRQSQTRLLDTRNQLEDAQLDASKAQRRLAKLQAKGSLITDGSRPVDGSNDAPNTSHDSVAAAGASTTTTPTENTALRKAGQDTSDLEATVKELEDLAAQRLAELDSALQERVKLVQELSEARAKNVVSVPPQLVYQSQEYMELNAAMNHAQFQRDDAIAEVERLKSIEISLEKKLHFALERIKELETTTDERWRDYSFQQQSIVSELELKLISLTEQLESQTGSLKQLEAAKQRIHELEELVHAGNSHLRALNLKLQRQEQHAKISNLEKQVEQLTAKISEAHQATGVTKEVAELKAALEKAEAGLQGAKTENAALKLEGDALYSEIESITGAVATLEAQHKRLLEQQAEKESQNASLMQSQMKVESQMRKMKIEQQVLRDAVETEKSARVDLETKTGQLEQRLAVTDLANSKSDELLSQLKEEIKQKDIKIADKTQLLERSEALVRQQQEEFEKMKQLQETSLVGKQEMAHKIKRLDENVATLRRRLEKSKHKLSKALASSQANGDTHTSESGQSRKNLVDQLKLEAQEEALRCPIYRQYWKDRILIKCMHMFSNKALMDNLSKRNRKCPTCKMNYSKDDIRQIYLYQSNDYGDN